MPDVDQLVRLPQKPEAEPHANIDMLEVVTAVGTVLRERVAAVNDPDSPFAVALDAGTLAALESISAVVSGTVALDGPTLAALETINAVCSGTVALDAPTLAALEQITAVISGSVAVTGPLTDAQLRASVVPISDGGGSLTVDGAVNADLRVGGSAVANGNPVPVDIQDASIAVTGPLPVTDNGGSLTVDSPQLPSALVSDRLKVDGSGVTQPVSGAVDVTDRAGRLLGHVAVDSIVEVEVKNDSGSALPVSGPLTDTQLRASAVPVSGTVTASGPLTDTQLRATAVPVSGTVATGALTDTQLRASAVPVTIASSTFTKASVVANASGDNTIYTPAAGKKIRLYFFGYSAGAGVNGVLAGLKFGAGGTVFDRQYLVTPGQPYARNIEAGDRYIDGAVDAALIVNLSAAQTIYTNFELEEI